jgi:hypothetical protein
VLYANLRSLKKSTNYKQHNCLWKMIGLPNKPLKADARFINQPYICALSKIIRKSKKKKCDYEIFSETNK